MLSIGPYFRKISAMHSPRIRPSWLWLALMMLAGCASSGGRPENSSMNLHLRSQNGGASGVIVASERVESWDPHRTAIIVCDMWDDHWCKSASSRVGELIEPMNRTLEAARKRGVFIIHAPSSVTAFYQGTPARELALKARHTATPVRWPPQNAGGHAGAGRMLHAKECCPSTIPTWGALAPVPSARCVRRGLVSIRPTH